MAFQYFQIFAYSCITLDPVSKLRPSITIWLLLIDPPKLANLIFSLELKPQLPSQETNIYKSLWATVSHVEQQAIKLPSVFKWFIAKEMLSAMRCRPVQLKVGIKQDLITYEWRQAMLIWWILKIFCIRPLLWAGSYTSALSTHKYCRIIVLLCIQQIAWPMSR